jgi:hypothetical protein
MYEEIKALKEYCDKIGVIATLEYSPQYFGYIIMFKNGSDCIQNKFSYGNENGKVEFGYTETRIDFKATTLKNAKAFVKRNKDKLNKEEMK